MTNIEKSLEILQKTNDGDDLSPRHLYLLECAVNGYLNEYGEKEFAKLYTSIINETYEDWFHGIKYLTIDHEGYVFWKGKHVEHYTLSWAYSSEAKKQAQELAKRCSWLEDQGIEINIFNVIWKWEQIYKEKEV